MRLTPQKKAHAIFQFKKRELKNNPFDSIDGIILILKLQFSPELHWFPWIPSLFALDRRFY